MMKRKSITLSVPYSYVRCYNNSCPQAASCLRYMAGRCDTSDDPFITIINPSRFPKQGEKCSFFQKAVKVRVAWGVSGLFDRIPHKEAVIIKKQLIGHFGKTKYYRFFREENFIAPKDQVYILNTFRNRGLTEEPAYTHFTEEYIW